MQEKNFIYSQKKIFLLYLKNNNIGSISFCLGTFFLLSAIPISILFYSISIIKSCFEKRNYLNNKYNLLLLITSGIMLFSTFNIISKFNLIFTEK